MFYCCIVLATRRHSSDFVRRGSVVRLLRIYIASSDILKLNTISTIYTVQKRSVLDKVPGAQIVFQPRADLTARGASVDPVTKKKKREKKKYFILDGLIYNVILYKKSYY